MEPYVVPIVVRVMLAMVQVVRQIVIVPQMTSPQTIEGVDAIDTINDITTRRTIEGAKARS